MDNYKDMYYKLFNSITVAIEILQEMQKKAEDMYISANETALEQIDADAKENQAE